MLPVGPRGATVDGWFLRGHGQQQTIWEVVAPLLMSGPYILQIGHKPKVGGYGATNESGSYTSKPVAPLVRCLVQVPQAPIGQACRMLLSPL